METTRHTVHVRLELTRNIDPIQGRLIDQYGEQTDFIGWLELIGALEAANHSETT